MPKVLFTNPPTFNRLAFSREGRCMQQNSFWSVTWPPMTLALCAAMARRAGWEAKILDGSAGRKGPGRDAKAFRRWLKEFSPEVVIANTGTPSINNDLALAPLVKEEIPNARMGYLGIHAAYFDDEILQKHPTVDFIIRGEAEFSVEALMTAGGDPREVDGITWRDGTQVRRNPDRDFSADLSGLPQPAWELTNPQDYRLPNSGRPFLLVSTVRGCPYACTYCHTQRFYGYRLRYRSPETIAEEMEAGWRNHGVQDFLLWSELFTADRDYVIKVCEEIQKRGSKFRWAASSRVDFLDAEMLRAMRESGCWLMAYGFESGDQAVLDANKKKATLAQAREAVRLTHEAGIQVAGHFVLGMPGETEASAQASSAFARELGIEYAQFYCAVPFPGSELYEMAKDKGWLSEGAGWEDYDQSRSVLNYPGGLQAADIERLRTQAYRSFYLRPRVLVRAMRQIRGLGQVRQLMRIGANFA